MPTLHTSALVLGSGSWWFSSWLRGFVSSRWAVLLLRLRLIWEVGAVAVGWSDWLQSLFLLWWPDEIWVPLRFVFFPEWLCWGGSLYLLEGIPFLQFVVSVSGGCWHVLFPSALLRLLVDQWLTDIVLGFLFWVYLFLCPVPVQRSANWLRLIVNSDGFKLWWSIVLWNFRLWSILIWLFLLGNDYGSIRSFCGGGWGFRE